MPCAKQNLLNSLQHWLLYTRGIPGADAVLQLKLCSEAVHAFLCFATSRVLPLSTYQGCLRMLVFCFRHILSCTSLNT